MSVGLFTGSSPVPMRGGDKQELITQLFGLTDWGDLDYLVVDLPPSMGDELLAAFSLFAGRSALLLVTTASPVSLEVVSRLRRLAEGERVAVLGAVVNMAYSDSDGTRSFPFGRPNSSAIEKKIGARLLSVVPLEPSLSLRGPISVLGARGEFAAAFSMVSAQLRSRQGRGVRRRGPRQPPS